MSILARSSRYVILNDKRGEGTFGSVYTGFLQDDDTCRLAFKALKEQDKLTGLVQHNNIREATFLAKISDELGNTPDNPFVMTLDIISGEELNVLDQSSEIRKSLIIVQPLYYCDLSQLIQSQAYAEFGYLEVCRLMRRLVMLVVRCHTLNYAHRDLKPNNVVLDSQLQMRLIDFGMVQFGPDDRAPEGLEKEMPAAQTIDCRSMAVNALYWRPPEQLYSPTLLKQEGDAEGAQISERMRNGFFSDSYVLGIMLLQLVLGTHFYYVGKKEDEGGVEELIAQLYHLHGGLLRYKHLLRPEFDRGLILRNFNALNGSNFADFANIQSWNRVPFEQLVFKILIVRFYDEVHQDSQLLPELVQLRNLITDLAEPDVLRRKTALGLHRLGLYGRFVGDDRSAIPLGHRGSLGGKHSLFRTRLERLGGTSDAGLVRGVLQLQSAEVDRLMRYYE